MKTNFLHFTLIGALFFFAGMNSYAATINVAQDGSGDYETIQAAIDAAAEGDTIIIHEGTYNEDLSIGDINMPPAKKNQLTLQAAEGAEVEIVIANEANRVQSLAELGADFGDADYMGFFVYGDGVVIEGVKIVQNEAPLNNFNINVAITIISSDVILRNCVFEGPGADTDGDVVGAAITPLDAVTLSQGGSALANNLTVEDCEFTNWPFAFASANFLLELGMEVPSPNSIVRNCVFYENGNGVEVDDGDLEVVDCEFDGNFGNGLNIGDGNTTVTNCTILNSGNHGIEVEEDELEDDDEDLPNVTVQDCVILHSGNEEDHHSLRMECGVLTVTNTVMADSVGSHVYFDTYNDRLSTATFDHCDLYQSLIGIGVSTTTEPDDIITATFTNCNIVDLDGLINDAGFLAEFTLEYCNVFADNQFGGETETISTSNILNTDPLYVDPDNGDFHLQDDSPVASAGADGTFIGALGLATEVGDWMVR